jgi:hypothetical protein
LFGSLPVPIRCPYRWEPSEPKHWAIAKNGEEEDDGPADGLGGGVQGAGLEQLGGDDEQHAGDQVRPGDHLAAAYRVEQAADGQVLAAKLVGQLAEEQRADDLADQ